MCDKEELDNSKYKYQTTFYYAIYMCPALPSDKIYTYIQCLVLMNPTDVYIELSFPLVRKTGEKILVYFYDLF